MYESEEDVEKLQALLDRSDAHAGPHLRSIFRPERRLSARQVVALFDGTRQAAVATVTARGEPRVAPVDTLLLHGHLHFGTSGRAARIRHLRARPAVSLTYFETDAVAVIAHGRASLIEFGDPDFAEVDLEFVQRYGGTPSTVDENVVYVRVAADSMFAFAQRPDEVPE